MNDELIQKLQALFAQKLEQVYEKNARIDIFSDKKIYEFNAWQKFLRESLSLEVVDIEEGETPGFVRRGGLVVAVRILNPSNAKQYSKEFILVPIDIANRVVTLGWIPDELQNPDPHSPSD